MTVQIFASIFLIYGANFLGAIKIDKITKEGLRPYMVYTVAFSTGVYTNMMTLKYSNVETVIVARAMSPLIVSVCDYIFLGRAFPSKRSISALSLIVVGALGYASTDDAFSTQGLSAYFWPFLYLITITFEMVYGKKIVKDVKFETLSGPVQYTNLLGWPPMIMFASLSGEFDEFGELMKSYGATTVAELVYQLPNVCVALVIVGCIVGTGIGYTGWWCRDKVSATSFTLVGVINKCLTVMANLMIWDQHAPPIGIFSLFLCLVGGTFYQQAPMRKGDGDSVLKAQATKDLIADDSKTYNNEGDEENLQKPLMEKIED